MTLISGSILSYSASQLVIFLFMKANMSPLVAKPFWIQDALFNTLALLQLIAYLLTSALIPCQNRLPVENIALRIVELTSITDRPAN